MLIVLCWVEGNFSVGFPGFLVDGAHVEAVTCIGLIAAATRNCPRPRLGSTSRIDGPAEESGITSVRLNQAVFDAENSCSRSRVAGASNCLLYFRFSAQRGPCLEAGFAWDECGQNAGSGVLAKRKMTGVHRNLEVIFLLNAPFPIPDTRQSVECQRNWQRQTWWRDVAAA